MHQILLLFKKSPDLGETVFDAVQHFIARRCCGLIEPVGGNASGSRSFSNRERLVLRDCDFESHILGGCVLRGWNFRAAVVLVLGVGAIILSGLLPSTGLLMLGWGVAAAAVAIFVIARAMPQRTLKALKLPAKYALPEHLWGEYNEGLMTVSPDSFPNMSIGGADYTAEQLYHGVAAFRDNFTSPTAMIFALLHPDKLER